MNIIRKNVREYGMYIALIVIWLTFSITSNGLFMSAQNINNLFLQTGYIAVLAVGMTLVIIIRHIDLSVGYLSGFLGAVTALLLIETNIPVLIVLFIVVIIGIFVGLMNGSLIARIGIPSFVVTLAGMLIFRGGLLQVTLSQTLIPRSDFFALIGSGYIPSIRVISGMHLSTLLLGLVGILFFAVMEIKNRKNKIDYNFEVLPLKLFIMKILVISIAILYITFLLASHRGFSWTLLIVLAVVFIYHFIMNKTVLGRHIYAVGGNPEAAKLSGINVKFITTIVFGSMGLLSAISGILFTARLNSAGPNAGAGFELDAVAAAYIGGVSAAGGVGKVTGSIIGALVMASLTNGMNLIGIGVSFQYIIRGIVLIAAVIFDIRTRNMKLAK
ncbi:MAG: sugar transporter permease [Haloplasmataceae bacterium]|jgi:putative multiple sugar transport system permease protein|nr:sugar transporter permease [Haloplasmataceae bacterium]